MPCSAQRLGGQAAPDELGHRQLSLLCWGGPASPGTGVFVPESAHKTHPVGAGCWLPCGVVDSPTGQAALLLGQLETGAAGLFRHRHPPGVLPLGQGPALQADDHLGP